MASDPTRSKYDPDPIDPNAPSDGTDTPGSDNGKDRSDLVPNVSPHWAQIPSYNVPAPPPEAGNQVNDTIPPGGPFQIALPSVRSTENTMLTCIDAMSGDYDKLRTQVLTSLSVFGPSPTSGPAGEPAIQTHGGGGTAVEDNGSSSQEATDIRKLAAIGQEFANEIIPLQEKGLNQLGNTIYLVGQYLDMLSTSGQSYAQTDRAAAFPPPPNGSPVES
jgi:hypothetical protein